MPHRLRKIRKKRGSRTQGYGRVGQHRKSGSKGRRRSGRHKHLWSYVISYEPDYFKKVRFVSPKTPSGDVSTINVGELEELAQKVVRKNRARDKASLIIDLREIGYDKLLGKGKITMPIHVKVASCSEAATKKVESAGGKVSTEK